MATGDYIEFDGSWSETTCMGYGINYFYVNAEGHIYKVHKDTGQYWDLGAGWSTLRAMGVSGPWLFVITEGGHLCRVNTETGGADDLGGGWEAVTQATCFNNAFYLLQHGRLYKVELHVPDPA